MVVHTKYDSVPITAVTSGLPSLLPFRNERMTAQQIKSVLDRFLGLAVVNEDENAEEDSGNQVDLFSAAWDTSAARRRVSRRRCRARLRRVCGPQTDQKRLRRNVHRQALRQMAGRPPAPSNTKGTPTLLKAQ